MEIKVTNPKGKTRTEIFEKAIIRIGENKANDICLSTNDISQFHLQVLNFGDGENKNRIVNLTDTPVAITLNQEAFWLGAYAFSEINNGDEVELGEYTLQFNLPIKGGQVRTSPNFKASLEFPTNVLPPETMLEGVLTLHNTGGKAGCQFKIEVEGLPEECFQIDPLPLLYPSAVEKVSFRLFHQGVAPTVGYQTFFITLSSPDKYPDHEVVLQHNIYISPYYKQQIEIIDLSVHKENQEKLPAQPQKKWKTITFENMADIQSEQKIAPVDSPENIKNERISESQLKEPQTEAVSTPEITLKQTITKEADNQSSAEKLESSTLIEEESQLKSTEPNDIIETPKPERAPETPKSSLEENIEEQPKEKRQKSKSENGKENSNLDFSNLKVIRNQYEDFWDDDE